MPVTMTLISLKSILFSLPGNCGGERMPGVELQGWTSASSDGITATTVRALMLYPDGYTYNIHILTRSALYQIHKSS